MSASISFRGYKQRRKLARSVVEWFFNHRKLNRFNVFLDIIDRRCRSTDAINGSCSTVDCMSRPRWFDIEMDNTQSESDYVATLIHELVHVEQRLRGRHQHRVAWPDYSKWEGSVSTLSHKADMVSSYSESKFALAFALIENHYFVNKGFLNSEDQLIASESIDKIRHIPAKIVQGRYDIVCPMETAWELKKNWPEAELIVAPSSGHSAFEKEITHELVRATEEFAKND